jgi:hypothetical protein
MTKKEYILTFLDRMGDDNDIALAMRTILQYTTLDDTMIDQMYLLISNAVHSANSQSERDKFALMQETLQRIRQAETPEDM